MRLWSLHPKYLDSKGLVALWREGLLAQKVLIGNTRGYKDHPQLIRFKNTINPIGAIATYLRHVATEAESRGYEFDRLKISNRRFMSEIGISDQQLDYEFEHLLSKLRVREPALHAKFSLIKPVELHPLFKKVTGGIADWERR